MKTFVLNMPKELISKLYWDERGGSCALGFFMSELYGFRDDHLERREARLDTLEKLWLDLHATRDWVLQTYKQNDRLTNPRSRVTNLKRRLRALASYGRVEFLFMDEQPRHKLESTSREEAVVC